MNEFYSELADKKKIASGARHRVTGATSHVKFPCDSLTDSQIKKKCGEMKVYQMKKPHSWQELLDMPSDLQKLYIEGLINTYSATSSRMAEMFGVSDASVCLKLKELGIKRTRAVMTTDQKAAWEKFRVME